MDAPNPNAGDAQPSIGELIGRLVADTGHLFQTELKLAQSEVKANLAALAQPLVVLLFGALFLLAALFTLMGALVGWLTPLVGTGWAAFIVAVVVGGIGLALVLSAKTKLSQAGIAPARTIESIKQDAQILKGRG